MDLVALLSHCLGMVANDYGITHFDAALGIPVIVLFKLKLAGWLS